MRFLETWNIEAMTGYKPITTFYEDFSIADRFGLDAIKDTYERAFLYWKEDYKFMTELVMALNWKGWRWYEEDDKKSRLYFELYEKLTNWCYENLKDEELDYFIITTD